jgi:acetyl esterase/lipase
MMNLASFKADYDVTKLGVCSYQDISAVHDGYSIPVNVYLPTVQNENGKKAVVCIHGGAWTSDLKKDSPWQGSWMKHHAYLLSTLGYIGIELTHRSIGVTDIDGVISDITASLEYVQGVLRTRHGFDSVTVIGDSAGGHLALMCAFTENKTLRPDKVVACNPVSDLTDPKWQLGTTHEEARKRNSPLFFSDNTDTQITVMHGDADGTVPYSRSVALDSHLRSLGCECELITLPGALHAFILYGYRTPTEKVNEYMDILLGKI